MPFQYTGCGLDNVYLANGYTIRKTAYGEAVSIQNSDGLHRQLGKHIINAPNAIDGAELRFLRFEMELSQKSLAALLGSEEQTVRRWEKARKKPIPGPADRLLRAIYREYIGEDGSVRRMVDRLAELDTISDAPIRLRAKNGEWVTEAANATQSATAREP